MNAREKMSFLYGLYLAHDRSENHTEKFMTSEYERMIKEAGLSEDWVRWLLRGLSSSINDPDIDFELMVKAEFPEWNFPQEEDESEN